MLVVDISCSWGGQSDLVFSALYNDFMKARISEVNIYENAFKFFCSRVLVRLNYPDPNPNILIGPGPLPNPTTKFKSKTRTDKLVSKNEMRSEHDHA